jgi:enoyl-CoA hydratase
VSTLVTVDRRPEHNLAICRLDDPESRNALSPGMLDELGAALESLDAEPEVRCIVVAGSAKTFASGADIRALAEQGPAGAGETDYAFWERLDAVETPLVAAVSGWVLGGGLELALACDMIVAAEDAQFGLPEITLGVLPGAGGTQRLTRAVGKARAMELILTGRRFSSRQALEWGVINEIAPSQGERWLDQAVTLAAEVASRAPIASKLAKQAVRAGAELPLAEGLASERELFRRAMATEDRVEGMRAFLEKRPPRFQGR